MGTGCTGLIMHDRIEFSRYESREEKSREEKPNGRILQSEGESSVGKHIRLRQNAARSYTFHDRLYVPSLTMKLISISQRWLKFQFLCRYFLSTTTKGRKAFSEQCSNLNFLDCKVKDHRCFYQ